MSQVTWTTRYKAPNISVWRGRSDSPPRSALFQIVEALDLRQKPAALNTPAFAVLGFCCDEGVRRNLGRLGAAQGPLAIREALAKLPLHRADIKLFDAGDIACEDGDLESAQMALGEAVAILHGANITPLVLGGGHEVAYGHYLGLDASFPGHDIGIVNIDAHLDMRPLLPGQKGSSGTPFLQIVNHLSTQGKHLHYSCLGAQMTGNTAPVFAAAKQHNVKIVTADELVLGINPHLQQKLEHLLQDHSVNYLTLCLDAFAGAHAPGVSAPQAFGLSPWTMIPLLRHWATSGRVRSYDIAELCPPLDHDHRTAKLAAQWLFEIIHHHEHHKHQHLKHQPT